MEGGGSGVSMSVCSGGRREWSKYETLLYCVVTDTTTSFFSDI